MKSKDSLTRITDVDLHRATDAKFLNAVCNQPSVRPHLHGTGRLDLTAAISNPNNFAVQGDWGGMIFIQHMPSFWEIHTAVLPEGRGEWALAMARQAVDWLFCRTNAVEVFTRVPEGNLPAMALTRACGAKLEQRVKQRFPDGDIVVDLYGGRIQDWIRTAPGLIERGRRFHEILHEKYHEAGMEIKTHAQDDWHDRHVGAVVGMVLGGQPAKGVVYYNRWAAMAMAPYMKLVSLDPLILDISEARLRIASGGDFEVMPVCQQESSKQLQPSLTS